MDPEQTFFILASKTGLEASERIKSFLLHLKLQKLNKSWGLFPCAVANKAENINTGGQAMVRKVFLTILFMLSVIPVLACAHTGEGDVVDVRIVSDNGGEFAKYRAYPRVYQEGSFFYVEAVKGDRYSIQVTKNQTDVSV